MKNAIFLIKNIILIFVLIFELPWAALSAESSASAEPSELIGFDAVIERYSFVESLRNDSSIDLDKYDRPEYIQYNSRGDAVDSTHVKSGYKDRILFKEYELVLEAVRELLSWDVELQHAVDFCDKKVKYRFLLPSDSLLGFRCLIQNLNKSKEKWMQWQKRCGEPMTCQEQHQNMCCDLFAKYAEKGIYLSPSSDECTH